MDRRQFMLATAGLVGFAGRAIGADRPTPSDLRDDVRIVREALNLHPGLYRYATPRQVAARLDRFENAFVAAPTLEGRFLALSRFLATIKCGHSYANFWNQRKPVASALFDRPTRLPFAFAWIDGQMVVLDGYDRGLSRGSIVHTIDGRPARALLATLLPYARADGSNDGKRVSLLEMRGDDDFEFFDIFQGLVLPPSRDTFALSVTRPDGRPQRLDLAPIGLAARQARMKASDGSIDAPSWTWEMRPDGVAVLSMPGWAIWNSKWDWRGWLDHRLDSLGGARGLVIDLRDNEGGADCGDVILARLIDRPLVPEGWQQRIRFERTPPALDPYLDTWDDKFRTLGVGARRLDKLFLERPGGDADLTIAAAPPAKRLSLPVAALIGPVNSSATFQFAGNARATGRVKLYGATTGGNRRGINGGNFFFVRLPASGIEFDLPLIGYFARTPQPDVGVSPDSPIAPTAADLAAGRDPVLRAAVADMIRS